MEKAILTHNVERAIRFAPDYLTELAKSIWKDTSACFPDLENENPELLTAYAQTAALVEEMQTRINEDGLLVPNSRGNPSAHPLLNTMRGMLREKTKLAESIRKKYKPVKEQDVFA